MGGGGLRGAFGQRGASGACGWVWMCAGGGRRALCDSFYLGTPQASSDGAIFFFPVCLGPCSGPGGLAGQDSFSCTRRRWLEEWPLWRFSAVGGLPAAAAPGTWGVLPCWGCRGGGTGCGRGVLAARPPMQGVGGPVAAAVAARCPWKRRPAQPLGCLSVAGTGCGCRCRPAQCALPPHPWRRGGVGFLGPAEGPPAAPELPVVGVCRARWLLPLGGEAAGLGTVGRGRPQAGQWRAGAPYPPRTPRLNGAVGLAGEPSRKALAAGGLVSSVHKKKKTATGLESRRLGLHVNDSVPKPACPPFPGGA